MQNPAFLVYIYIFVCVCETTAYDTLDTQPLKNMTTSGKVDTSELMMIIRRVVDISPHSPKLKWASYNNVLVIESTEEWDWIREMCLTGAA